MQNSTSALRWILFLIGALLGLPGCNSSDNSSSVQAQSAAPVITSAQVDSATSRLTITGTGFGAAPTVQLGSLFPTVVSGTDTSVIVMSPATLTPGSYGLTVKNTTTSLTGSFVVTLGAVGPMGPIGFQGPTGAQGPSGPQGPMGPGGINGVGEFFANGTFTVPANITHVMVEMWGGGGGGAAFGAGGGGAYTRTVVGVTPGATYNVNVGAGGTGGINGNSGSNAGDSQFTDASSNILTFAGGGQGGAGQAPEIEGPGGKADPTAMISHAGYAQCNGTTLVCAGVSGGGGAVYEANLAPQILGPGGSQLRTIGIGGAESAGSAGQMGYVRLAW
jgi:hypothetical protein